MKKNILVLLSILLLFISCSNLVDVGVEKSAGSKNAVYTVTGRLVSGYEDGTSSRSAFPANDVDLSLYTTNIYYKESQTATQRTLCGTTTGSSFELKLPSLGTYYLEAESFNTEGVIDFKTNQQVEITLTEDAPYKNDVSLFLKVIVGESDATGSIGLYMKYFDPFVVIYYEITENGISIHNGVLNNYASVYGPSGVNAGVHNYVFSFYDATYSNLVYQCTETVTVFPNKTTDTWVNNGKAEYFSTETIGGKETVVMNITQECLDNFAFTNFYVKESADDSNNGSYFTPFRTLDKALSKCTVAGVNYSINIDGDYTQINTESNYTVPAGVNVKINGLGASRTRLSRSSSESSPFITVSNGAVVTINNLGIEGTDTLISYDGTTGIYNEGTLTLNNCTVSKFKSNKYGGIHTKGKLVTKDTEIFGNVADDAENGIAGGVFVESGTFEFRDGYIHDNSAAKEGAGVYVNDSTCTFKMSGSAHLTTDNVVYLNNLSFITIDGDLTSDTAAKIKLSSCANANSNNLEVLKPENGASVDNYGKFKMDKYSYNDGPYTYTYTLEGNKIKRSKSNRR